MKIKLTKSLKEKISQSINEVRATNEQRSTMQMHLQTADRQFQTAQKHLNDLLEIVGEANGQDVKTILASGEYMVDIKEDTLILEPSKKEKFSQQVKKQLNRKK